MTHDKLVILKVVVGVKDVPTNLIPEMIREVTNNINESDRQLSGYFIQRYIVPCYDHNNIDMVLLYPPANSFLSEKEYLDLLIKKGDIPAEIVEQILLEVELNEESKTKE